MNAHEFLKGEVLFLFLVPCCCMKALQMAVAKRMVCNGSEFCKYIELKPILDT